MAIAEASTPPRAASQQARGEQTITSARISSPDLIGAGVCELQIAIRAHRRHRARAAMLGMASLACHFKRRVWHERRAEIRMIALGNREPGQLPFYTALYTNGAPPKSASSRAVAPSCASPRPSSSKSAKNGLPKPGPTSSGNTRMADQPESEFPDLRLHNLNSLFTIHCELRDHGRSPHTIPPPSTLANCGGA